MDNRKIVLISDSSDIQGRIIEKEMISFFGEQDLTVFNCSDHKIEYCTGCFSCRYKTPGKCIHDDVMDDILRAMVESDIILLLSRMEFGCYSSAMKRVLDRSIPFEQPFLRITRGETHLVPRYPKERRFVTAVYADEIDEEEAMIFARLSLRNSVNFDAVWEKPVFFRQGEDAADKIKRFYGDLIK